MTGTLPTVTVSFAYAGSTVNDPNALGNFVLNTSTLGPSGTDVLGSFGWTQVPQADIRSLSIRQGQADELSPPAPGTATIVLDNAAGDYDWINGSQLEVGVPVWVQVSWAGVDYGWFRGTVADLSLDMGLDVPTVTVACLDALETLGRAKLDTIPSQFVNDLTGTRVGRILDAADWPTSMRSLDAGVEHMQATTYGDFGLPLLVQCANTEFGVLFVDGDGKINFFDRLHVYTATRSLAVQATFADARVNQLFGAAASFDSSLGGWVNAGNSTPAFVSTPDHTGNGGGSMRLRSSASGDMEGKHCADANILTSGIPVVAGNSYSASAWFQAAASARSCRVRVLWYDSTPTLVSTSTGSSVTDSTTGWTQASELFTAPAGAVLAVLRTQVLATGGASEDHFVDDPVLGSDDTVVDMTDLAVDRSFDTVFTQASITRDGGTEQIYTDSTAVSSYGIRTFSGSAGSQLPSDTDAADLASWIVGRYKTPKDEIGSIQIDATTQAMWSTLLPLRLYDRIAVSRDYGPHTVSLELLIQGIELSANAAGPVTITFATRNTDVFSPLILDTSTLDAKQLA